MRILMILFLLLGAFTVKAELQWSDTKETLKGLDGVYIVVQVMDEQPEGITTNSVADMVKAALNAAAIPVNEKPKKFNGDANLSITVDTIKQPQLDAYIFRVDVAVIQDVRLARDSHAPWMSAVTWNRSTQGFTSPDRTDVIEQVVKQAVGSFVADYRAVNPGK